MALQITVARTSDADAVRSWAQWTREIEPVINYLVVVQKLSRDTAILLVSQNALKQTINSLHDDVSDLVELLTPPKEDWET